MVRAVAPRLGLPEVMMAEEQEEYMTLCVSPIQYEDGSSGVITRWRLDDEDRRRIAAGEDIFLTLLTFGHPMPPVAIQVGPPWAIDEGAEV